MILRELQITNFRQIAGSHTIRFAQPGDRPVTLILGDNGAGKTTLLNACRWCLYGRKDFENPGEVISHRALENTPFGREVESRVRLVFDAADKTYTVERVARLRKRKGGQLDQLDAEDVRVDVTDEHGATRPSKYTDPRQEIGQLLPEPLSGFFFFQGEDLEDLVAQAGSDKLKDAVETFVDLLVLDRSVQHLGDVVKNLERKLRDVTAGDARRLSDEIEELHQVLDEQDGEAVRDQKDQKKILKLKEKVEDRLAEIEEVRPLVEERRMLDQKLVYLDERMFEKQQEIARAISDDGYLHLRSNVLIAGTRLADDARQRGDLPAKIKPQFVNDLIDMGTCICGKEIDEGMRGRLLEWLSSSALGDLETAINGLSSDILRMQRRAGAFKQTFQTRRLELAELRDQWQEAGARRSRIEGEIKGKDFGRDEIRKLQAAKNAHDNELVDIRVKIARLAEKREELESDLEELRVQRDRHLKEEKKGARIGRQIKATEKVRRALQKLRAGWVSIVQEYLDQELRKKWDEMAQLPRLVQFDKGFRLTIKERGGDNQWRPSAPSSANKRALALSFVTSLIKLADKAQTSGQDRRLLFAGGQYPLLMDAPFATMDSHFKRAVPAGLRRTVPQLVLVTNHDQWVGEVEAALDNAVGAAYALELHAPKDTGTTINFRGGPVDYVVADQDTAFDWSEIKEIMP